MMVVVSIVMVFVVIAVVVTFIVVVGDSAHVAFCSGAFSALARGTVSARTVAFPDSSGIGTESAFFRRFFTLLISGFFRNAELSVIREATDSGRFRK